MIFAADFPSPPPSASPSIAVVLPVSKERYVVLGKNSLPFLGGTVSPPPTPDTDRQYTYYVTGVTHGKVHAVLTQMKRNANERHAR